MRVAGAAKAGAGGVGLEPCTLTLELPGTALHTFRFSAESGQRTPPHRARLHLHCGDIRVSVYKGKLKS